MSASQGEKTSNKKSKCCVVGCTSKKRAPGISWYSIPKADFRPHLQQRRQKWIELIRLKNSSWVPDSNSRICSAHFFNNKKSEDPRSPSYNPSIFTKIYNRTAPQPKAAMNRYKFQVKKSEMEKKSSDEISILFNSENNLLSEQENEAGFVDYIEMEIDNSNKLKHIEVQTDFVNEDSESEKFIFIGFSRGISSNLSDAETQANISTAAKKQPKSLHESKKKNVGFVGFESIKVEQELLDLCGTSLNAFKLLLGILVKNNTEDIKKMKVQLENRLFLFLMKMKLNLTFAALAAIFNLHGTTSSRIFYSVLATLSAACKDFVYWPSKEVVQETVPQCFKPDYSNYRVIIDATEFLVEQPPDYRQRVQFYSHYKKGYRLKIVIGCTPAGLISFISKIYGGNASDSHITVKSGLIELLEPGDIVLADKGFPKIKTVINSMGKDIVVVMPPFLRDGFFTEEQVKETYDVARVRIHIERIMQRIRVFRINEKFTTETLPYCDDIIRMCCVLVNLQPPIIKSDFTTDK